jgi:hypothetical protein
VKHHAERLPSASLLRRTTDAAANHEAGISPPAHQRPPIFPPLNARTPTQAAGDSGEIRRHVVDGERLGSHDQPKIRQLAQSQHPVDVLEERGVLVEGVLQEELARAEKGRGLEVAQIIEHEVGQWLIPPRHAARADHVGNAFRSADIERGDEHRVCAARVDPRQLLLQLVLQPLVVVVEERDPGPVCCAGAGVACLGSSHLLVQGEITDAGILNTRERVHALRVRAIDHDDDFKLGDRLAKGGFYRPLEQRRATSRWDDDAH